MPKTHKETLAIQSVKCQHEPVRPVVNPIYLSTTYERNHDGSYNEGYVYTRSGNPNRSTLEKSISLLENGKVAYAFSSGMAAITAVLQSLKSGDHIILPDDVYYKIRLVMDDTMSRWGLNYTLVDMADIAAVEKAIQENTSLIWMESPSNPLLKITDIAAVAELARGRNIITAVDNTWATPVLMQPLDLGVDVVVHSTTKYFGGHSDVLGGAVVLKKNDELADRIGHIQDGIGAVPSPWDSWLVSRGIQTLALRVKAQSQTAFELAQYLEAHSLVSKVYYPGLESHEGHAIANQQMSDGYGAMLSFCVSKGEKAAAAVCNAVKIFTQATSLGGVESLIEHRRAVEGPNSTTPPDLVRVSVGLEHIEDLKHDLDQALKIANT